MERPPKPHEINVKKREKQKAGSIGHPTKTL